MTQPSDDDPPPFLGTWNRLYTAVLLYCTALIGALYLITRWFEK